MNMNYTVYLRTNLVNGKQYVGQTKNFKQREYNWYNTNWSYAGRLIDNARNKYGVENWNTKILKECETLDDANYYETYYIKEFNTKYPNGYNLTNGGEGTPACIITDETRKKLSEAMKGENNPFYGKHHSEETIKKLKDRIITDEWKRKISEKAKGRKSPMLGKHLSEETRKKISEARKGKHYPKLSDSLKGKPSWNKGKHLNEEIKEKISKSLKGRYVGEKNPMYGKKRKGNKFTKKVYQYTLDDKFIREWESTSEASRELGLKRCSIRDCCKGGRFQMYKGVKKWYNITQCGGFKWYYKSDYEQKLLEELEAS